MGVDLLVPKGNARSPMTAKAVILSIRRAIRVFRRAAICLREDSILTNVERQQPIDEDDMNFMDNCEEYCDVTRIT